MFYRDGLRPVLAAWVGIALLPVAAGLHAEEEFRLEEVVVTAQRRAETVQDVPIAVSAFDAQALESRQIDTFSDLQFNVPNVSYSKGNYSGSNFQIRGIGTLLTAASGDSGVGMHVNDVYVESPRIFETEYYDMERVEILRGPQGTLYGRNVTGGAVNLKTARPDLDEFGADIEAQFGNFDHRKVKGMVNIPLGDQVAARFAGIYLDRDGYTKNVLTGNDVDDREQWSVRGSIRWEPTDRTTIDLIGHYFDEESSRTRSQKQLCVQDPSPILGCLPTGVAFESVNPWSTAGVFLGSNLVLGPLGAITYNPLALADLNPDDFREISAESEPRYESDETFIMTEIRHDLTDNLQLNFLGSYQDTKVRSEQDFNGVAGPDGVATIPLAYGLSSPASLEYFGTSIGGPLWASTVPDADKSLGAVGGGADFRLTQRANADDLSLAEADQMSFELRLSSNFEGPVNFMVSGFYLDYNYEADYFVKNAFLDYFGAVFGGVPDPGPGVFTSLAPAYFNSETDAYDLESWAVFGELYWEASETVKVTLGLRYSNDDKSLRDRGVFINVPVLVDAATGANTYLGGRPGCDGQNTPVADVQELLAAAAGTNCLNAFGIAEPDFDADVNIPGGQEYRIKKDSFDDVTGRIVVDWTPEVGFTDDTLVYFSYSRGFKSGGINPPIDTNLFPATAETFDSEKINAYEIGTKNSFMNNRLQANLSAFYYDYGGLQIGKIVNRTSLNENTDADVFGVEGEFLFAPNENWMFNANFAFLDTELGDTETVDPRDPTQGRDDVTLYKDFITAANCVIENTPGLPAPNENPLFIAAVSSIPGSGYIPTGPASGIPETPGVAHSALSVCPAIAFLAPLFGYGDLGEAVPVNIKGNDLSSAPSWSFGLGAQYTHYFGNGMTLSGRVDYYWQDDFYATTFNRPQDRVDSWDVINAQVVLTGKDERWYAKVFGQNLGDEDNITGAHSSDPAVGVFTNVFLIEPRLYGVTVGVSL